MIKIKRIDENVVGLVQKDGPTTSKEAAVAVFPRSGTQRHRVLQALAMSTFGLTDEDIEDITGLDYNSSGPRRRELVNAGWVKDSGEVRKSGKGVNQVVWKITTEGLKEWRNHG